MRKTFVHFLWALLVVVVLGCAGAFWAIAEGKIGYMPPIEDLQNPINRFATQVFSADGKVMGTWNYTRKTVCAWITTTSRLTSSRLSWLRRTHDSTTIRASTSMPLDVPSSSVESSDRRMQEADPPSPSSLPSSFIRARRTV